jgi:hypothetical protein
MWALVNSSWIPDLIKKALGIFSKLLNYNLKLMVLLLTCKYSVKKRAGQDPGSGTMGVTDATKDRISPMISIKI